MPEAHRHDDTRNCGAKTVVEMQTTVFVNNKLWAVRDDPNNHGEGRLIPIIAPTVLIEGKEVIVKGDLSKPDDFCPIAGGNHCAPKPDEGSPNVSAGG